MNDKMITLSTMRENIGRGGDRPFFMTMDGITTYAQFRSLVGRASSGFDSARLKAGDRVLILLEDEVLASAAFVAALFRGLVPVLLSHESGKHRRDAVRGILEPALVIDNGELFDAGGESHGINEQDDDQLAYLIFTSGTTGDPSGVEITRGNLFSHLRTLVRLFGFGPDTRLFNPTPLSHTDGLVFGPLMAAAAGGCVIRPGPLNVTELDNWLGMIRTCSATHMVSNPTVLGLIDRASAGADHFGTGAFKGIISSASHLRSEQWERLEKRFGTQIWNLYGLTETVTSALYAGRHPEMGRPGSLGRPIDCEARVAPLKDHHLSGEQNDIGELELRGPHIFRGYWRNPVRTSSTISPDRWMKTGDLVRLGEDGSFEFLGRVKAAINSGGTLIRGEEIDECLLRHPAVLEAVTVGIADEDFEEIAVSAVVLAASMSEADLTRHCRAELERLKVPKRIISVPAIPRGDAGKPNLGAVRDLLRDEMRAPECAALDSLEKQVIDLAALIFRTDPGELSPASSAETVEGWDSFTHVNLVLQAEEDFAVRIPGDAIPKIRTLSDLTGIITKLRAG